MTYEIKTFITFVFVIFLLTIIYSAEKIRVEKKNRQIQYEENLRKRQRYEEKLRNSGILEVDTMDGKVFEDFLMSLLKKMGYRVITTSTTGDYGVDLILYINDKKIIVQV